VLEVRRIDDGLGLASPGHGASACFIATCSPRGGEATVSDTVQSGGTMVDYQIDARRHREIRVGRAGEVVATFQQGKWIQDMKGKVENEPARMKLPAPWRGMRYRLEMGEREIANASKPRWSDRIVSFDLEMPGRKLELKASDRHGLEYVLREGGEERGRFTQRDFGRDDEWSADFRVSEESAALAAFVTWLVREGRRLQTRGSGSRGS
jgi:hypothetical protein